MKPSPSHHPGARRGLAWALAAVVLAAAVLLAQEAEQKRQEPPKKEDKKADREKAAGRIFSGKITLVSSRQEEDTAGHGFKGVGDDGQVTRAALKAQPGAKEHSLVAAMRSAQASPEELAAFLEQGNLKRRSTRQRGGS